MEWNKPVPKNNHKATVGLLAPIAIDEPSKTAPPTAQRVRIVLGLKERRIKIPKIRPTIKPPQ